MKYTQLLKHLRFQSIIVSYIRTDHTAMVMIIAYLSKRNILKTSFNHAALIAFQIIIIPVLFGATCSFFIRFQHMNSNTKLTAKDAADTHKHLRIRRLRDPNPMEDVPDRDSGKHPPKTIYMYLAYPSNPG